MMAGEDDNYPQAQPQANKSKRIQRSKLASLHERSDIRIPQQIHCIPLPPLSPPPSPRYRYQLQPNPISQPAARTEQLPLPPPPHRYPLPPSPPPSSPSAKSDAELMPPPLRPYRPPPAPPTDVLPPRYFFPDYPNMVQRAMRIRHEMALLYKRKYTSARAFITHFEVLLNMHDRLHYPMSDHQKSILLFQGLQCYSWSRTVNWHRKVIRGELTFERLMVLVKAAFPHLSSKVTETKRLSLRAPVVQSRPARMRPTQPMPQQQERTSRVTAFMNLKFTGCA